MAKEAMKEIKINYQMLHFISVAILLCLIRDIKAMDNETFIAVSPTNWIDKESAIADIHQEILERSWEEGDDKN